MRISSPSDLKKIIVEASGSKKAEKKGYVPVLIEFNSERRGQDYQGDVVYSSPLFRDSVKMAVSGYDSPPERSSFREGLLGLFDPYYVVAEVVGEEVRFRATNYYERESIADEMSKP